LEPGLRGAGCRLVSVADQRQFRHLKAGVGLGRGVAQLLRQLQRSRLPTGRGLKLAQRLVQPAQSLRQAQQLASRGAGRQQVVQVV